MERFPLCTAWLLFGSMWRLNMRSCLIAEDPEQILAAGCDKWGEHSSSGGVGGAGNEQSRLSSDPRRGTRSFNFLYVF